MKFVVKTKKVTIVLDSEWDEPAIECVLKALCYVVQGVDLGGQWDSFDEIVIASAHMLKRELEAKK